MSGPVAEIPDEDLVRRIQADPRGRDGEVAAEALFGRYRSRVYLWCFRYVRDHERALDLAQDVLLNAWRALERFDGRAPFGGWLFVIARNRCFGAMRPVSLTRDDDADLEAIEDARPGPEERAESEAEEGAVIELMREVLDRDEQDAIALRCFERLPVDEVTRRLGIEQVSGARALLQRARRKLRVALDRREHETGGSR